MFTKQHYKAIAEIIRHAVASTSKEEQVMAAPLANELADYFTTDNDRFDRKKFMIACGLG